MAQYFTDFSEYTTGSAPSDWTARWVTTNVTYSIVDDAGATGGKVFRAAVTAIGRIGISWNDIDSDGDRSNAEIFTRFRTSIVRAYSATIGPFVRGSGTGTNVTAYFLGIPDGNKYGVNEYVSGTFASISTVSFTLSANTWYYSRFRVNGSDLKAKFWSGAIGDEPASWGIETTDTSISAAGWVGLWNLSDATHEYDVFGVGTNGDTAPSSSPSAGVVGPLTFGRLTGGGILAGGRLIR